MQWATLGRSYLPVGPLLLSHFFFFFFVEKLWSLCGCRLGYLHKLQVLIGDLVLSRLLVSLLSWRSFCSLWMLNKGVVFSRFSDSLVDYVTAIHRRESFPETNLLSRLAEVKWQAICVVLKADIQLHTASSNMWSWNMKDYRETEGEFRTT